MQATNRTPPNVPMSFPAIEAIFSPTAVRHQILNLPLGIAAGNSGILAEVLVAAGEPVVSVLTLLFRTYSHWSLFLRSWLHSRIHPVPKKVLCIINYRPIALFEVPRKGQEGILLPYLSGALEPLPLEQGGFRAGRGTYDQIATLNGQSDLSTLHPVSCRDHY